MFINNVPVNAELIDILIELRRQLNNLGIQLFHSIKDGPENVQVSCPYHKNGRERRPSAGIKKSDGTFHCFTCGEVHSLQEMISYCFGYDDPVGTYGFKWILQNFATVDVEVRKDVDLDFARNPVRSAQSFVSEEELESYRVYHPYMWKRKMTPEVVEIFDVGYDDHTKCITFPVRDVDGNTLFIARRGVNTKMFNYPMGVRKPVYGLYELAQLPEYPKEVIICESIIDCITCWVYGRYAVALNGLGDLYQFWQLKNMPCRKFILGTDNDLAGHVARNVLWQQLHSTKIVKELIFPPDKKDINDLTKEEFDNLKEFFITR